MPVFISFHFLPFFLSHSLYSISFILYDRSLLFLLALLSEVVVQQLLAFCAETKSGVGCTPMYVFQSVYSRYYTVLKLFLRSHHFFFILNLLHVFIALFAHSFICHFLRQLLYIFCMQICRGQKKVHRVRNFIPKRIIYAFIFIRFQLDWIDLLFVCVCGDLSNSNISKFHFFITFVVVVVPAVVVTIVLLNFRIVFSILYFYM